MLRLWPKEKTMVCLSNLRRQEHHHLHWYLPLDAGAKDQSREISIIDNHKHIELSWLHRHHLVQWGSQGHRVDEVHRQGLLLHKVKPIGGGGQALGQRINQLLESPPTRIFPSPTILSIVVPLTLLWSGISVPDRWTPHPRLLHFPPILDPNRCRAAEAAKHAIDLHVLQYELQWQHFGGVILQVQWDDVPSKRWWLPDGQIRELLHLPCRWSQHQIPHLVRALHRCIWTGWSGHHLHARILLRPQQSDHYHRSCCHRCCFLPVAQLLKEQGWSPRHHSQGKRLLQEFEWVQVRIPQVSGKPWLHLQPHLLQHLLYLGVRGGYCGRCVWGANGNREKASQLLWSHHLIEDIGLGHCVRGHRFRIDWSDGNIWGPKATLQLHIEAYPGVTGSLVAEENNPWVDIWNRIGYRVHVHEGEGTWHCHLPFLLLWLVIHLSYIYINNE